jgi:hypothetical protein
MSGLVVATWRVAAGPSAHRISHADDLLLDGLIDVLQAT